VSTIAVGSDLMCGYVILELVDEQGNASRAIRVNYDDSDGIGSDEEADAAEKVADGVLTCAGPKGKIPGFKKCGALARYMLVV
jgi:hypothetical protein